MPFNKTKYAKHLQTLSPDELRDALIRAAELRSNFTEAYRLLERELTEYKAAISKFENNIKTIKRKH